MKVNEIYYSQETDVLIVINSFDKEDDIVEYEKSGFFKTKGNMDFDDLTSLKATFDFYNYVKIGVV